MAGLLTIAHVDAWQVLDSRGTPTVCARVILSDSSIGIAAVPSGASTGRHEAFELRDGGASWKGRGVTTAVGHVRGEIAAAVTGRDAEDLEGLDDALITLDATPSLSRLGANAVLSVSIAAAIAVADSRRIPLWQLYTNEPLIPMPMVNIVSGGAHASHLIDIQDILVIPVAAKSFAQALEWACRVRAATADVARKRGMSSTLVADEGGIAGQFERNRDALSLVVQGVEAAGLRPGADVALALDIAATQFQTGEGRYHWDAENRDFSSDELIAEAAEWCDEFPIVSIEDVVGEDDWSGWANATQSLSGIELIGDDLFVTNEERLAMGVDRGVANSVLVKVNQSGTLTSARHVLEAARRNGYATVVSARSGETEDCWLADLAVGWRSGQIKVGSTTRSERLAKWNRLLQISHDNPTAEFAGWPPHRVT